MPPSSTSRARFGAFDLNVKTRELCNGNQAIQLQEQPYRVLLLLLERGSEGATRQDIQSRLWPDDTTVDFERSINAAVKNLRKTLSDSPDRPKYIETLPKVGYKLLVPVQWVQWVPTEVMPKLDTDGAPTRKDNLAQIRGLGKVLVSAALLVLVALFAGFYYYRSHLANRLVDKDTVVLADFANSTGDPVFDDTLKTGLSVALDQSPFLNVLPDSKVAANLQLMARLPGTVLTPEVARELCQRANSKAYIAGSIAALGNNYMLELKAVNCQNGDLLAQEQVTAVAKEKVLDSLGTAAIKLRSQLGESLATVQKFDVPLAQATTPSLEALKAYSLASKAGNQMGPPASLNLALHALELDPNFAMGYRSVGLDYYSQGELGLASEFFTKAFQLRDHASAREALMISADYYSTVTGELDKVIQTYQELIQSYPNDPGFLNGLGTVYATRGEYEEATEVMRQAQRVAPDAVAPYADLGNFLLALQRLDEARQIIREALARKLDDVTLHNALYAVAFLSADSAGMAEQQQWLAGNPEYENFSLALASDTEAYAGHLGTARELSERAAHSAVQADSRESGATWQENAALREAAFGNEQEARQAAAAGLRLVPKNQGVKVEAALAFAMTGDAMRAESLANDLNQRYPKDLQMQSLWLPAIHAQLALQRKTPAIAIQDLQPAVSPIEGKNILYNSKGNSGS